MARFREAIACSVIAALKKTADLATRIEVPKTWPVAEALGDVAKQHGLEKLKVGVLPPFRLKSFSIERYESSDAASKITRWRNQRGRAWPLVVCGRAEVDGAEGLRDFARMVRRPSIIALWRELEGDGAAQASQKPEVGALIAKMFDECEACRIDAVDLDVYLSSIATIAPGQIDAVYSEMWRARLIPDDQALDKGASGRRLATNLETVARLESEEERNTKSLLRKAAREQTQLGRSAKAALRFAESGDKADLASVRLSDVLAILGEKEPTASPERTLDLADLLNFAKTDARVVRRAIADLASEWDLNDPDSQVLELELELDSKKTRLRLPLQPTIEESRDDDGTPRQKFDRRWLGDGARAQVLVARLNTLTPQPFDDTPGWDTRSSNQFEQVLRALAEPGADDVAAAFEKFVRERAALFAYEPWLDKNMFELLVVSGDARTAVNRYLDSWRELLSRAIQLRSPGKIIHFLQLIDAAWGPDLEEPKWAVLGPLHPYRLDPLRRVADHVASKLQCEHPIALGDAAAWLRDRCYPAYPAVYCGDRTLHLSRTENDVIYTDEAQENLPRTDEGSGLGHCIECIEGFAPQLGGGLVLLLVDPPPGRAVGSEIGRLIQRLGEHVTVLVAGTRSDANTLDELDGNIHYVGRFADLQDWLSRTATTVHVAVRFSPQPKGTVAARHGWSATRGSFLAPHLEVSLDPLASGALTPVAEVKVEPREDNGVVYLAHELYRKNTGNTPRHFQFRPLLPKAEIEALKRLADRADWLIVGAPGPMGIATPSRINSTMSFVGRDGLGPYGLYVYATDGLFSVRRFIEHALREVPVNVDPGKVAERLALLAKQSGAAILRMGKDGIDEHQAALVALRTARDPDQSEDYLSVVLRVDDLGWTRIWIGDRQLAGERQRRCDFLLVRIAHADGVMPRVIIRAVESKSDISSVPLEPLPTVPPFSDGRKQVETTLNALAEVLFPEGIPTLDQDVRFSTFIEHVMAAVLSSDPDFTDLERLKRSVETLNALSARALIKDAVRLEGFVVVTQSGTNADAAIGHDVLESGLPLTFVRATAKELSVLFGGDGAWSRPSDVDEASAEKVSAEVGPEGTNRQEAQGDDEADAGTRDTAVEVSREILELRAGDQQWAQRVAQDLVLICEKHQIPIADREPSRVLLGPSLVSVAVRLKIGAQLNAIEKRLEDLTRDIGLGDRANEVSVMNDAEPSTVRFLIPRPHREFPNLPEEALPFEWDGAYLPIRVGRTLEGRDLVSSVENWPHLLLAGTTGSGKTTFLRTLLKQFAGFGKGSVQLVVVDGKGDTDYLDSVPPSMFAPEFPEPLLGHARANEVLEWAVAEMEARREKLHALAMSASTPVALKWPDVFRGHMKAGTIPPVRPVVIVIDEFADLMLAGRAQAEGFLRNVQRVAQVGRSRMIHLVLATQRPDKETIRGAIKTNLDARVVMRLPTAADSQTVLGHGGAERLLKYGDLLFESGGTLTRLQGYRG